MKSRYILITVDTEALRHRAVTGHVKRLIWGEHDNGTAGIREMCSVMDDVHAKMVFFVDVCGTYFHKDKMVEAIKWLDAAGQDVQLHTH